MPASAALASGVSTDGTLRVVRWLVAVGEWSAAHDLHLLCLRQLFFLR